MNPIVSEMREDQMPPKAKFTREEIIDTAFNLLRQRVTAALTCRDIAAALGTSTRPIFTYFRTMDELKTEVRLSAENLYRKYSSEGLKEEIQFLGFGVQFVRFAREEPELYRLLFLTPPAEGESGALLAMEHTRDLVLESICRIYSMDEATADFFFRRMWLVGYSVSVLVVTGGCTYSDDEIKRIFTAFAVGLCKACKEIPGFISGDFDRDKVFGSITKSLGTEDNGINNENIKDR